jgi:hypothetical protein
MAHWRFGLTVFSSLLTQHSFPGSPLRGGDCTIVAAGPWFFYSGRSADRRPLQLSFDIVSNRPDMGTTFEDIDICPTTRAGELREQMSRR